MKPCRECGCAKTYHRKVCSKCGCSGFIPKEFGFKLTYYDLKGRFHSKTTYEYACDCDEDGGPNMTAMQAHLRGLCDLPGIEGTFKGYVLVTWDFGITRLVVLG
jgi:hypothetical protein